MVDIDIDFVDDSKKKKKKKRTEYFSKVEERILDFLKGLYCLY